VPFEGAAEDLNDWNLNDRVFSCRTDPLAQPQLRDQSEQLQLMLRIVAIALRVRLRE